MTTILVTGVGAVIGYGILRSLRKSHDNVYLIGTDIYSDAVGQAWTNQFHLAPLTSSDSYLEWLSKIITENQVDLVIPGIEQDLHFFSDNRDFFTNLSVRVALNNKNLIDLSRDKWLMDQELLRINSLVRIPSLNKGDFLTLSSQLGLPFIMKPRASYASKGLVRVYDETTFSFYAHQLGHSLIAQPIIGSDNEEYTVAVFGDATGAVCASITLQRKLASDGSTAKAWIRQDKELEREVRLLCHHFKPLGPTNLQFRKDSEGWKLLEINPRISSTTSIRTAFGYNEAKMCLDFFIDGENICQPIIRPGFAVRYIEDVIIYDQEKF